MATSPLGPSAPPPGLAEVAEAPGRRSHGKPGVLIVDDSPHVRDLLKAGWTETPSRSGWPPMAEKRSPAIGNTTMRLP